MTPDMLHFPKSAAAGSKQTGITLIEMLTAARLIQNAETNLFSAIPSKSTETHYHFHLPPEEYSSSEYGTKNRGYETTSLDEITVKPRNVVDDEELLAVTARHLKEVNHAVQTLTKHIEHVLVRIEERGKNEFNR